MHWLHRVTQLVRQQAGWTLQFAQQPAVSHQQVVLANGHALQAIGQSRDLPVYAVAGQVSHVPTNAALNPLRTVLCYDGYLTPVSPNFATHCIGASYHRGETTTAFRADDQQENRQRLINCLPQVSWPTQVDVSADEARSGVRCATRDHLPMSGSVPDYAATLGEYADLAARARASRCGSAGASRPVRARRAGVARTVQRAAGSKVLAAQMSGEPQPLDSTLAALHPNRYWVRKLLKGKKAGR